jgi:hypothetical protein
VLKEGKWINGCDSTVECLHSMLKLLDFIPNITHTHKKKTKKTNNNKKPGSNFPKVTHIVKWHSQHGNPV